jgi:hypothetical protein
MRTTIDLPDGLFRQVKTLAVQKGLTLKDFFTAAVERAVVETPIESRRADHGRHRQANTGKKQRGASGFA